MHNSKCLLGKKVIEHFEPSPLELQAFQLESFEFTPGKGESLKFAGSARSTPDFVFNHGRDDVLDPHREQKIPVIDLEWKLKLSGVDFIEARGLSRESRWLFPQKVKI